MADESVPFDDVDEAVTWIADSGLFIEITSAYPRLQAGVERTLGPFVGGFMLVAPTGTDATDSVRCRPRTTRGGEPAVVRTAMTRSPMGSQSPGHSTPRETNESSSGVSPVPSKCYFSILILNNFFTNKIFPKPNESVGILCMFAGILLIIKR